MAWRYLPDVPTDTPETWAVCDGYHADKNGVYRAGLLAASYGGPSSPSANVGIGKCYRTTSGTLGILLAFPGFVSAGNLYVYDGSTWNDRGDGTVAGTAMFSPASVAQYGNITLIGTSGGVYSRDATTTDNFALVTGSQNYPNTILVTPRNIVVTLCTSDLSGGHGTDVWATSDAGDYTNWSTGEAASGNLRQTPGGLTAGVVLGDDVIAFKRHGVFRGTYVGGTVKWSWQLINSSLGCWGPCAAINAADKVYFWGDDGFYSFDGASFNKLDSGISHTIQTTLGEPSGSSQDLGAMELTYDSLSRCVCIFNLGKLAAQVTPARSSQAPAFFTYNIDSGAWGYQSRVSDTTSAETFGAVIRGSEELNSFTSGAWTYNSNIALWSVTNTNIRVLTTLFTSSNVGTHYTPKLRTSRFGQRGRRTTVSRFVPGWCLSEGRGTDLSGATTKTATPYTYSSLFGSGTAGSAITLSGDGYWADYTKDARYHAVELSLNCDLCIDGGAWDSSDSGSN